MIQLQALAQEQSDRRKKVEVKTASESSGAIREVEERETQLRADPQERSERYKKVGFNCKRELRSDPRDERKWDKFSRSNRAKSLFLTNSNKKSTKRIISRQTHKIESRKPPLLGKLLKSNRVNHHFDKLPNSNRGKPQFFDKLLKL